MKLPDFILANLGSILAEWEIYARGTWPGDAPDPATLRDHAEAILQATALDMRSEQTALQQSAKSKGKGHDGVSSTSVNLASQLHGLGRAGSRFDLGAVVAEYRALRASVLHLWRESGPSPDHRDLDDLTRFNEAIDQGLTEAIRSFTQEVAAEDSAAEISRGQLAAIVESSDDAIISKNLDGTIVSWNKSAERLFGYTASEAIGRAVTLLIPPDRLDEEPKIIERLRRGERVDHFETVRVRKDGTPLPVSLTISPVKDGQGRIVGASKVARDITERKEADAQRGRLLESERHARSQAEHASQLKDEFLATLSHELRTPLNAILGWAHLIEKTPSLQETVREGIDVISRNAKVQVNLIADLLDMSRIISGKIRLDIAKVVLSEVVQSAIDSVLLTAEAKNIRIQPAISTISDPVRGDANRLHQVVWNLLTNAIKFTPKGGRVQVVVCKRNSHAEIEITDTGKGIKKEFLPFVFDRFRQADSSAAREHGGLGIGLAIVKNLAELHGGWVRAESAGEGRGSSFMVGLPLSLVKENYIDSKEAASATEGHDRRISLQGVQVLAVEDEPDTRDLLRRILEDHHANVLIASSGEEALGMLDEHKPHVVLSDIGMPRMDGYDFLRQLRKSGNNTPAIAVTAFARSEDRTRALVAGYHGHITKPIEPTELVATVAAFARTFPAEPNGIK